MCSYLDKVLHSLLVMNSFTPLHLLQLSPFSSHQILFPYPTSLYQHSHVLKIVAYPLYSWIVSHAQNILFSLLWSCYSPPSDASVETAGLVTVSAAWLWVNLWEGLQRESLSSEMVRSHVLCMAWCLWYHRAPQKHRCDAHCFPDLSYLVDMIYLCLWFDCVVLWILLSKQFWEHWKLYGWRTQHCLKLIRHVSYQGNFEQRCFPRILICLGWKRRAESI